PNICSRTAACQLELVEDRQVELTKPLGVGEDVHLDDLPAPDGDGADRERLPVADRDGSDGAVDGGRPHDETELRVEEGLAGDRPRAADLPQSAGQGAHVRAEDDVGV